MTTVDSPIVLSYRTIRRDYQAHSPIEEVIVDHYAKLLSPFFTLLFVRAGIIPNVVTVLMMVSGILGAALFAFPWLSAKIGGILLIHLWYVLDCSDGEVARITRRFSRMGAEIDYTAHLVCHPLFNLAFASSLISLHRYNPKLILIVAIISISAELMLRNLISLRSLYELKLGSSALPAGRRRAMRRAIEHVAQAFYLYPNFALIFPFAYFVDLYARTSIGVYYLFIATAVLTFVILKAYAIWTRTIVWKT